MNIWSMSAGTKLHENDGLHTSRKLDQSRQFIPLQ